MTEKTDHLKPFGYTNLFASRDTLNEVWDWINQLPCCEKVSASTAAGMAVNTLLQVLDQQGMLYKPKADNRKIVVVMENGIYQTALANFDCDDIEMALVEYDDHGNEDYMIDIPQTGGGTALAYARADITVYRESPETLNINQVFKAIQKDGGLDYPDCDSE